MKLLLTVLWRMHKLGLKVLQYLLRLMFTPFFLLFVGMACLIWFVFFCVDVFNASYNFAVEGNWCFEQCNINPFEMLLKLWGLDLS